MNTLIHGEEQKIKPSFSLRNTMQTMHRKIFHVTIQNNYFLQILHDPHRNYIIK